MKIGAVYPQIELGGDPEAVRRIGTTVEALGYDLDFLAEVQRHFGN
jgi:hypothetical protein